MPGSFCGCFRVTLEIAAGKEGPYFMSPASGCRRAGAALSLVHVSYPGRVSVPQMELRHCMPAPKDELPPRPHLCAVVTPRTVKEILMPKVSL